MSIRIGLGIDSTQVRAIAIRDGRIVWYAQCPVNDGELLGAALTRLLSAAPRGRTRRPELYAAISPALCQVRRIEGLPEDGDEGAAARVVASRVTTFFLGGNTSTSAPVLYRNGVWWGAVFDDGTVAAVQGTCAELGMRFGGCIPAVAALATLVRTSLTWSDAGVDTMITIGNGAWIDVKHDRSAPPPMVIGLDTCGNRFADAFAAARYDTTAPLVLRESRQQLSQRSGKARKRVMTLISVAALGLIIFAPGLRATLQARADEGKLASLQPALRASSSALQEWQRTDASLGEIARFSRTRRSLTMLIGQLAQELPDSSAVVSAHIDSTGGTATVLAVAASSVLPALERVPGIESVRITGAVTRESFSGTQLQRLSVRFRRAAIASVTENQ